VELVAEARSNREIARELGLTHGTVKEYMVRIFRKLGVRNRVELALLVTNQTCPE
jgi:DNA-binding NarL/FixJ family response regulator